jgi:hypothetical protein
VRWFESVGTLAWRVSCSRFLAEAADFKSSFRLLSLHLLAPVIYSLSPESNRNIQCFFLCFFFSSIHAPCSFDMLVMSHCRCASSTCLLSFFYALCLVFVLFFFLFYFGLLGHSLTVFSFCFVILYTCLPVILFVAEVLCMYHKLNIRLFSIVHPLCACKRLEGKW